ncbi:PH domain-containing protein [Kordiimonas aestuarii]|uniref:PH domain-containing protein n=1 Tax=Kordiimonas aestuarii TaxID=1005925 RepID=UPI0021D1D79B|nr:PH domain-containing protein [Kordiimonas aestuarii]
MPDTDFSTEMPRNSDLPQSETLEFEALDAHRATILMIIGLAIWAAVSIVWTVVKTLLGIESPLFPGEFLYLLPLIPLPFIIVLTRRSAAHCGYAVRAQDVHYRHGIIWRSETSLPFNRIQHVEVERGPLERIYGLSTLKFFAAGGGSADLTIPSLKDEDATRLRAFILEKAGADHSDD